MAGGKAYRCVRIAFSLPSPMSRVSGMRGGAGGSQRRRRRRRRRRSLSHPPESGEEADAARPIQRREDKYGQEKCVAEVCTTTGLIAVRTPSFCGPWRDKDQFART